MSTVMEISLNRSVAGSNDTKEYIDQTVTPMRNCGEERNRGAVQIHTEIGEPEQEREDRDPVVLLPYDERPEDLVFFAGSV
jgi:hypothetical protein